jgi:hypothetical protein
LPKGLVRIRFVHAAREEKGAGNHILRHRSWPHEAAAAGDHDVLRLPRIADPEVRNTSVRVVQPAHLRGHIDDVLEHRYRHADGVRVGEDAAEVGVGPGNLGGIAGPAGCVIRAKGGVTIDDFDGGFESADGRNIGAHKRRAHDNTRPGIGGHGGS